jgi:hypothetical protein
VDGVPTILPTNFRAKRVPTSNGQFGYIRIFTFKVTDADIFVNEFVSLAQQLPQDGLIIDVRGNGGGLITAAEKLLQVLTYEDIQPQKAQFVNTSLNLKICENHAPSISFSQLDLGEWVKSIKTAVETGATYSHGYTITDPKIFDDITWHYPGKVVLIVDALCYSATDIFAAGFQDHKIGDILGIHEQTGAGGANVWSHHLLQRLLSDEVDSPYQSLPLGANFNVAIRRTIRSGENAGDAVDDWGVRPVNLHRMTRQDLLESNIDLLNAAGKLLAAS